MSDSDKGTEKKMKSVRNWHFKSTLIFYIQYVHNTQSRTHIFIHNKIIFFLKKAQHSSPNEYMCMSLKGWNWALINC